MESFNFWLRMDLVGISFAVWAPTAVFLEDVAWCAIPWRLAAAKNM